MGTYNPIPLDDGVKELRLNVGKCLVDIIVMHRSYQVLAFGGSAAFRDGCCFIGKSIHWQFD